MGNLGWKSKRSQGDYGQDDFHGDYGRRYSAPESGYYKGYNNRNNGKSASDLHMEDIHDQKPVRRQTDKRVSFSDDQRRRPAPMQWDNYYPHAQSPRQPPYMGGRPITQQPPPPPPQDRMSRGRRNSYDGGTHRPDDVSYSSGFTKIIRYFRRGGSKSKADLYYENDDNNFLPENNYYDPRASIAPQISMGMSHPGSMYGPKMVPQMAPGPGMMPPQHRLRRTHSMDYYR